MNCKEIQNRIDEIIFDHDITPEKEIKTHLESCSECRNYYDESLKDLQFLQDVGEMEPVLDRPEELTYSIMESIAHDASKPQKPNYNFTLFTRLLAAAVIALLLTLGIEQYLLLNKILDLETKLGKVELPKSIDRTRIYKATLVDIDLFIKNLDQGISLNKIRASMKLKQVKQFDFTFYDINRYMIKDGLFITDLPNQTKNGKN
jgi:hypothetical protein